MTATEELRRMLDEHGVEHIDNDDERDYDEPRKTTWDYTLYGLEMTVTATESVDCEGTQFLDMEWHHFFTPEQAIAATFGGGKLTAEQVREIVEKHWHDLPAEYDMPESSALPEYSYDWQAIADDLNATLDSGECELIEVDSYSNANEVIHVLECSACGETCEHVNGSYPKCPHCGKSVKR